MNRREFTRLFVALQSALILGTVSSPSALATKIPNMPPVTIPKLPYETRRVPGTRALKEWETLRKSSRLYPVVVGDSEQLNRLAEQRSWFESSGHTTKECLETADAFNYPADFRLRQKKDVEVANALLQKMHKEDPKVDRTYNAFHQRFPVKDNHGPQHGEWPTSPPEYKPLAILEKPTFQAGLVQRHVIDEANILMFPTTDWTDVFAMVGYGGWNACPQPQEHVAAFRRWRDRFGLEIVGMSGDTLELRPARHPQTREDALALAMEHYEFCPDIVDQGGPIEELAAGLLAGNWWYFWWD